MDYKTKKDGKNRLFCFGGDNEIRTRGLLNAIQTRYQLRHTPELNLDYNTIF